MTLRLHHLGQTAVGAALAGLIVVPALTLAPLTATAASALAGLEGSWGGTGSVVFEGGSRERLRCNGYYKGAGDGLSMAIRCASPGGAKIELRGNLQTSGSKVSGTWEERTYNATGSISGSAGPSSLRVGISGAINGSMSVSYSSSSQSVTISTTGTTLRTVNISFRRR